MQLKEKFVLLLTCLMSSLGLQAFDFGNIGLEAEWIYFQPSIDNTLLLRLQANPGGQRAELLDFKPDYHSGWRLGAFYQFCDGGAFGVRWTQLRTRDSTSYTGTTFSVLSFGTTSPTPISVEERFKFDYRNFEALLSVPIFRPCRYQLSVLGGVEYTWLGIKDKISIPTVRLLAKQGSHFWGVGPKIGVDLAFALCQFPCHNLSLVAHGAGSLLVSKFKVSANRATTGLVAVFDTQSVRRVVPSWDFRGGVCYEGSFNCINFYLEGGYETIFYVRGLQLFSTTPSGNVQIDFSNADMHGPYISAGVLF